MIILKKDLIDLQVSQLDTIGHVYMYKGRIIRIINKTARKYVDELMKCGLIDKLIKEGILVDSWISDDTDEEGRMVLEHKRIAPRTYLFQWSFEMMKDAAKLVLRLNSILWEYGYELKDCHQYNILFDGTRPIYVDFGSIVKRNKKRSGWTAREEFFKCYYYPIKLWSKGYTNIVEALMNSSLNNLCIKEMRRILWHLPLKIAEVPFLQKITPIKSPVLEMRELFFKVNRLKYHDDSVWGEYQSTLWKKEWESARFNYEIDWINATSDIDTMIEVGANQGYFSYLVATRTEIKKIIATDYDKNAVDIMYRRIKEESNDKITPIVLDFMWTPLERLKEYRSDLVVANALTHHLLLTQGMKISAIAERLAELTEKYVIVEFMEYGITQKKRDLPKWYTLDWFLAELQKRFSIVLVKKTEKRRIMIIGKKIEENDFIEVKVRE